MANPVSVKRVPPISSCHAREKGTSFPFSSNNSDRADLKDDEQYVRILTDPSPDPPNGGNEAEEKKTISVSRPRVHARIQRALRAARQHPTGVASGRIAYYISAAGAANTAFAADVPVIPRFNPTELALWAGVFDEYKVTGARILFKTWLSILPTAFPAQTPNVSCCYDPTSYTALASVHEACEYDDFIVGSLAGASGNYAVSPQAAVPSGFHSLQVKVPSGSQLSNTTTAVSAGVWRPTTDPIDYEWGHFKFYVAQAGTSAVVQVESFLIMDVEFRMHK